jgi:p-cumate 2,3-dioxygenase alpha subunit
MNVNCKLVVDDRRRGLFRVNRQAFVSPEILDLERERVFDHSWLYVGHQGEVASPGDFVTRDVGGRPLVMCRGSDGEIRVLMNTCTHRGAQICREPEGNASTFQCFYHAWTFDNRGELIGVPDAAGYADAFRKSEMRLAQPAQTTNYRGLIFVSFDSAIEGFVDYLAGAKEYLDLVLDQGENGMEIVHGTQKYAIKANWKLLVENSMDGYHLRSTHQTYLEYLKDTGADFSFRAATGYSRGLGNGHGLIEYQSPFGRPIASWEPRWGEEVRVELDGVRNRLMERLGAERGAHIADFNRNLLIYPNLIVNDIMSLTVRTFYPIAPDYMEVSAWAMGPVDELARWRELRLDSFLTFLGPGGFATPDDVEALEACQRGFRAVKEVEWSDISRGMHRDPNLIDEEQMRSFWRRWREQIETPAGARGRAVA